MVHPTFRQVPHVVEQRVTTVRQAAPPDPPFAACHVQCLSRAAGDTVGVSSFQQLLVGGVVTVGLRQANQREGQLVDNHDVSLEFRAKTHHAHHTHTLGGWTGRLGKCLDGKAAWLAGLLQAGSTAGRGQPHPRGPGSTQASADQQHVPHLWPGQLASMPQASSAGQLANMQRATWPLQQAARS